MTNPQYLLLDAKWLEEEMKTVNVNYVNDITAWNVLNKVKANCRSIFSKEPLVEELREVAITAGEFDTIYDRAANEIERLWEENSALASNQCHDGYGDDYGNHRCRQIDELRSEVEELKTQLALYEEPDEDSHIPCDHNFQSQVNDNSSQYDTLVCTKCGLPTMSCTMTITPDHEEETSPQPEQSS